MRASGTPIVEVGERKRERSLVYDLARFFGSPFSYDVEGFENIQNPGPAVFIANHLGPTGPIEIILSVPIRFYPWVISEMADYEKAPQYLFDDFVHPVLHLGGRFGLFISTLITKISVRLFKAIGAVSIDRFGGYAVDGFRHSMRLLKEGKNLLIFPENSLLPLDPHTSMRPFMPGFATLCKIYMHEIGDPLPVYPLAVNAHCELVSIGKPEFYQAQGRHAETIQAFSDLLESRVRQLYLDMQKAADTLE
jgi:1-acyl-sn-glycerol-3-phosphate acyltransferase